MEFSGKKRLVRLVQDRLRLKVEGHDGPQTWGAIAQRLGVGEEPGAPPVAAGEKFDARTEKNLRTVEPEVEQVFRRFLRRAIPLGAEMGVVVKVICGRRGPTAQQAALAAGASRAAWGYSWHNYGLAIDLGLFAGRSYVDADNPPLARQVYRALRKLARETGLHVLGEWDLPHFQIPGPRKSPTAAMRRRLFGGTWNYKHAEIS